MFIFVRPCDIISLFSPKQAVLPCEEKRIQVGGSSSGGTAGVTENTYGDKLKTRCSAICNGILESGWLLALAVIPLFVNIFARNSFETSKAALLRSIVLVMALAWTVKRIEEGFRTGERPLRRFLATPLVAPVLLVCAAYLLSTIFSVLPILSLRGSYDRMQGLYSMFCYAAVFFLVLDTMERKEQVERALLAVILASIPVSLYGIAQYYAGHPAGTSVKIPVRVAATMGNPIFLGAYLLMVVPVTLFKIIDALMPALKPEEKAGSRGRALLVAVYTAILCLQLVSLGFTQSRGPFLGLAGAILAFSFILLVLLSRQGRENQPLGTKDGIRALAFSFLSLPVGVVPAYVYFLLKKKGFRWLWLAMVFQVVIIGGVFLFVAVQGPGAGISKGLPALGRLADVRADTGTARVRSFIWEGASDLLKANVPRAIVGYGPETMRYVWGPYHKAELAQIEATEGLPDRAHNETFDTAITTGLIGLAAYLLLVTSLFYYAFSWFGFYRNRVDRIIFLILAVAGMLAGALIPGLTQGSFALSGVTLLVGLLSGAFAYLVFAAFLSSGPIRGRAFREWLLPAMFLSVLVGHLLETSVGIAVTTTRLYFFTFGALLVVAGQKERFVTGDIAPEPAAVEAVEKTEAKKVYPRKGKEKGARLSEVHPKPGKSSSSRGLFGPLAASSLLVGLILFTLGFSFLTNQEGGGDPFSIMVTSLTSSLTGARSASLAIPLMFLVTFVVCGLVILRDQGCAFAAGDKKESPYSRTTGAGLYASLSAVVCLIFLFIHASFLSFVADPAYAFGFYCIVLCVIGLGTAYGLVPQPDLRKAGKPWKKETVWLYPLLAGITIWIIWVTNVTPMRADVYFGYGVSAESRGNQGGSIDFYRRAISLAPGQDRYYLYLGRTLFKVAALSGNGDAKERLFRESAKVLGEAQRLNPLNMDYPVNLGILWAERAESESSAENRARYLGDAERYFQQAAELSPRRPVVYNNWARVYAARGDYGGAVSKLKHSLSIDAKRTDTYLALGEFYEKNGNDNEALKAYRDAIPAARDFARRAGRRVDIEPWRRLAYLYFKKGSTNEALKTIADALDIGADPVEARSMLGYMYWKQNSLNAAIDEYRKILGLHLDYLPAHQMLATLYQQSGRTRDAIPHMEVLARISPDPEREAWRRQLEQMNTRVKDPRSFR
jgi:tetratricopeptide (TPR) repeat protein